MTEAERLNCDGPSEMLSFLWKNPGTRKPRLFACACCRRVWRFLSDHRLRDGVEVAERFADGQAAAVELEAAVKAIDCAEQATDVDDPVWVRARLAAGAARSTVQFGGPLELTVEGNGVRAESGGMMDYMIAFDAAESAARLHASSFVADSITDETIRDQQWDEAKSLESRVQANLLRDIFGNPFRPVAFDPRWRTTNVVGLAQAIYDDKAFDRMPLLADALMDAGCEDEQVIGHCRGPGPHVRGCWVVDLVLGKN